MGQKIKIKTEKYFNLSANIYHVGIKNLSFKKKALPKKYYTLHTMKEANKIMLMDKANGDCLYE